ncbi:tubulin binding cofactor A, partial [Tilletiopsis washingtonensis]
QTLRQLKIKTGVVKRLTKEEKTYAQEAEDQKARIERITREGADEWDVKKQHEVLRDCEQMIPDCARRLAAAVEDLQALL